MIQHSIQNFDGDDWKPSHLSVVYCPHWMSFYQEERSSGKKKYGYQTVDGLDAVEQLTRQFDYDKIKLGYAGERFALIPKDVYSEEHKRPLASSHFFLEDDHVLKTDSVYRIGLKNLYTPNGLGADRSHVQRYHFMSPMLSFLPSDQDRVYLLHTGNDAVLISYKDKTLRSARFYQNLDEGTVIYHLIEAFKMADLDPHHHNLFVGGRITQDSQLFKVMKRFVKNIHWLKITGWQGKDDHLFYDAHLLSKYF